MKLTSHALYLRVADLGRSLRFYRDGLGFEVDGEMEDGHGTFFARARKDGLVLLLSTRTLRFIDDSHDSRDHEHDDCGGHPYRAIDMAPAGELGLTTFIYVDDVDDVYNELLARGVEPLGEPVDQFYGLREFLLRDPDGYYLAVGQRL
jgi:uncharacterized glyoxalase superfamily protein PhnB